MSLATDLLGHKVIASWIKNGLPNTCEGIIKGVYVPRGESKVLRFVILFKNGELFDIGCDGCRVID